MSITGNAVGNYNIQSDWVQIDESAPDYIKNKPNIPTKPEDIGAQPAGDYLTEVPEGYVKSVNGNTPDEDGNVDVSNGFIVNITGDPAIGADFTADKTLDEIYEAHISGRMVVCHVNDEGLRMVYHPVVITNTASVFVANLVNKMSVLMYNTDGIEKAELVSVTTVNGKGPDEDGNVNIRVHEVPANVSAFKNDAGYVTEQFVTDKIAEAQPSIQIITWEDDD